MNTKFTTLIKLSNELSHAFQLKDWGKVAELDAKAQLIVHDNSLLIKNESDKAIFMALIAGLQSFYDQLSAENMERRSELGSELKKLNKEHNAISQYLKSSAY